MIGGVQYIDGHKPVQTMKNRTKLAGWSLSEQTAAEPSWARTYNDRFDALVLTGATVQNGTPDPSNPIYPASAGGILRVNGVEVANIPTLRGHGEKRDTYDVLTGTGIRRVDPEIDNVTTQKITDVISDYILDPPQVITGSPLVVPTRYPTTALTQDNAVKASITAAVKVAD